MVDSQLVDRVHTILKHSPHLNCGRLKAEATHGRVVLRGKVQSYYQKQMAQEAIRRVEGVGEIENCLEVDWLSETRQAVAG
jgi:osmotically-inducible protein OsmY